MVGARKHGGLWWCNGVQGSGTTTFVLRSAVIQNQSQPEYKPFFCSGIMWVVGEGEGGLEYI